MTGLTDDTENMRRLEVVTDRALAQSDLESLLEELLDRITDLLKVDTAAVLLIDKDAGELVTTATKGLEEEVLHGFRVPVGHGFSGTIFATGQPRVIDHVDETNVVSPILLRTGIQSLMGTPLVASGEIIGVLSTGTRYHRKFREDDVRLLQVAADRVALATQARQTYAERVAAVFLQRSLLPGRLPSLPGLEMGGRYIPGGSGSVGGDWYDVFPLPAGRTGVAIGDVVGRGMTAAVVMGRLRSALRAYALESTDPADVLERLDRKAQHFEAGQMTTVLYMVIEPGTDELIISSAGHLLPIIAPPHEAAFTVDVPVDPPLATLPAVERRRTAVSLPAGAAMCLFTDGLVERRDEPLTDSLERLRAAVAAATPNSVCEAILFEMLPSQGHPDDIALLVLRRTGSGADD
ncbi:MAG TPA: GAF domain-containing SpoIIE family protein phosphatase [Jiangellaceae bacterium]